ncbi:uncharacterized protein LACBIDRAFT_185911 [Laccaria bicolor S238N-H82]|uniref:Guanine deaminase n=1 Tax=Laccaria bicolor (strain S238N-H82 / ATCC MYA-4686) TaxID=486041 RepID=B0DPX1_LACBS|nr:uncharacterized protein LACBIDRAFT_185911 [Laccaria bicolor S238N-H82]EDR03286.1 predicted protein [Laccaria bicolor S238N-H82]|eukprot:XP_001886082.1 predicted protein [Laccaria bicolor S238N-H82]
MSGSITIFYGAVINPTSLTAYSAFPRSLIAVGPTGNIEWITEEVLPHQLQDELAQRGCLSEDLVELKDGEFLIPGFVDTHTHAPQVPNMGVGQQYELLDWLEKVTFPTEAKFSDLEFAQRTYQKVVRQFIGAGTTTCCYYGTLHLESTKILADIVHSYGQRAFVGKCNMNRESPHYYVESSTSSSLADTRALITYIRSLPSGPSPQAASNEPLVQPILTPRFAISCTSDLLASLGEIASSDPTLRIQTHISENPQEVKYTKQLFPDANSYADVYDKHGLLNKHTILAHAVHLEVEEVELIRKRGAGISHCPTSNFNLRSGVAPVGVFLDKGIKVGLGTDVSGGFSHSMLTAIQHASMASKVLSFHPSSPTVVSSSPTSFANRHLPIATLFYLATMGGASVCGLDAHIGSFAPGKAFDALLVTVRSGTGAASVHLDEEHKEKKLDEWLERFLFCGDDRNIERVYVQGRLVGGRTFTPAKPLNLPAVVAN